MKHKLQKAAALTAVFLCLSLCTGLCAEQRSTNAPGGYGCTIEQPQANSNACAIP